MRSVSATAMASAPPEPPFADDGRDDGHAQFSHRVKIVADCLGLTALFRVDARIGSRRIDEGEHRQIELFRQLHQPERLAIPLGTWHAEIAVDLVLGVAPLLMADHHARMPVEAGKTADDGVVVRERTVAMQFLKFGEHQTEEIKRIRPLRMTRHLGDLPGRELRVYILGQRLALRFQSRNLFRYVDCGIVLNEAQFLDLCLKFGDLLFKIEKSGFHRSSLTGKFPILPRTHPLQPPITQKAFKAGARIANGTVKQRKVGRTRQPS
jgi:hypothetical protein